MGSFSIWHWLIVMVIVLALFGTKKLRNVGGDLGGALKSFKDAVREEEKTPKIEEQVLPSAGMTVEGEIKSKTVS
jgi:sec-independent protein translocase protein TatA